MHNSKTSILLIFILFIFGCGSEDNNKQDKQDSPQQLKSYDISKEPLPTDLVWKTNSTYQTFSSPDAKKGGTYNTYLLSFPPTLRYVGPDSNSSFANYVRSMHMYLVELHPNTEEIVPALATHWAFGKDNKTVYYKLDKRAKWSDGKPITADDYLFTIEFMRSKFIRAPWYNEHYTKRILDVSKYDDYTISITGDSAKPKSELFYYYGLRPTPRHFYKLDKDFIKRYNWKVPPVSGAYRIDEKKMMKGKSITMARVKNWWAKDLKYYKNRFNVDKIHFKIIRDINIAYEHFKKGELDSFEVILPEYWHDKAKGELYDKGYIIKHWFFTDAPQPQLGLFLNTAHDLLKDINIRKAIAHSFNVDKLLKTILRNDYFRLQQGYIGYGDYTNNDIRAYTFDIKKADSYLNKAGWSKKDSDGIRIKDGRRLSFRVSYGRKHHADRLALIKEEMKKAGIELTLDLLDQSAAFKKLLEKKHEIHWGGYSTGFRPAYWEFYHSDNANKPQTNNVTNTADKNLDLLIEKYRDSTKEQERTEISKKIQTAIHKQCVFLPSYMVPYFREVYWRYWKFPEVPATKISESLFDPVVIGTFWLDQEDKNKTLEAMKKGNSFEPQVLIDKTYLNPSLK